MIFIGTTILLTALLVYLARWIPTTRKIRTRIQFAIVIGFLGFLTLLTLRIFSSNFREHPFSARDVNKLLELHEIHLNDDFELTNKKISGVMDYTLEFELLISESDKSQTEDLIKKLINKQQDLDISNADQLTSNYQGIDTTFYFASEQRNSWNLEFYHKLSNDYIRTQDVIEISKQTNKLSFARFE